MESRFVELVALSFLKTMGWGYYLAPKIVREMMARSLGFFVRSANLRRRVVDQNLEIVFADKPESRKQMVKHAYNHLGYLTFEIMMLLGPMKKFIENEVELRGQEHWRKANERGKGVFFLSSHVGNWEVMAGRGALSGIDLMIVTKHLKPEWLHKAIEKGRLKVNVKGAYEPRTIRDVMKHLGQGGTVGLILDQYAGPPVGYRVPFMGVNVGTSAVIATLAKRYDASVLPVVNYRNAEGKWVVDIRPETEWISDQIPEKEIAKNTAHFAAIVEEDIKDHPEQWMWIHRRFKGDLGPAIEDEWIEGRPRN